MYFFVDVSYINKIYVFILMNHGVHLKRLRQPSPRLLAQIQDVKEGPGTVGVVNVPRTVVHVFKLKVV